MCASGLHLLVCLLLACVWGNEAAEGGSEWGYYNVPVNQQPDHWKDHYPDCGKMRQSPIHITGTDTTYKNMGQFQLTGYDGPTNLYFEMSNNGHTISFTKMGNATVTVSGGGLPATYNLVGFHFHWGSGNTNGSEHWVNSRHYAAEVHLVHMNEKYTTVAEAVKDPEGLAVLGAIVQVEGADNPKYTPITDHIHNVAYANSPPYEVPHFKLSNLLPNDHSKFFRYLGSLTTPACNEAVVWSVFSNPISFSQAQIDLFRTKLHHEEVNYTIANNASDEDYKLTDNHRLPQPLNGRTVFINYNIATGTATCLHSLGGVVVLAAVFIGLKNII